MREMHIRDFCKEHGQTKTAEVLGCTQPAVSLMLKTEREIYFNIGSNGAVSFYELKRPGRKPAA